MANDLRKPRMLSAGYLRVCLDRLDNQAGVDSVWEQEKTRSQPVSVTVRGKMPVNRARAKRSPTLPALSLSKGQVHALLARF